jgi:hypothetical protein
VGRAAVTASKALVIVSRTPEWRRRLRLEVRLRRLPRDVGVVLLTVGAAGLLIPGPLPPGTPFVLAGAIFLCPRLLRPVGGCLLRRIPVVFKVFEGQVWRFQSDLERRYPGSTSRGGVVKSGNL